MSYDGDMSFEYGAHSRGFLGRAQEHLRHFDETASVPNFFYAALELRYGIEARLWEYLRATLKQQGQENQKIPEYVATKLLRKLSTLAPESERALTVLFTRDQSSSSNGFEYTPVTRRLASLHGQLGELLHFKFFCNNPHWFLKMEMDGKRERSLINYRTMLEETVTELEHATRGRLLIHPHFTEFVVQVLGDSSPDVS